MEVKKELKQRESVAFLACHLISNCQRKLGMKLSNLLIFTCIRLASKIEQRGQDIGSFHYLKSHFTTSPAILDFADGDKTKMKFSLKKYK